jgi:hypothetical protein
MTTDPETGVAGRPPRSRRRARLAANPSGAIYGTIVATSVVAAGAHDTSPGELALATAMTLLVFWLAHVYAQILQRGMHDHRHHADVIRTTVVEEFAMVEAPGLSIIILTLGAMSWIDDRLAINLALANGVAQLLLWGIAVARQLGLSWSAALMVGLVYASLGVLIVMLKVLLH